MKLRDKLFLIDVKEYIEQASMVIDCEYGFSRNLEELIRDKVMPQLYNETLELLEELK